MKRKSSNEISEGKFNYFDAIVKNQFLSPLKLNKNSFLYNLG